MLNENINKPIIALTAILSFAMLLTAKVNAGEVKFIPSLEVAESYSDNILLASKGSEQGEFVTELKPAFLLQMQGRRFNANVYYSIQDLHYLKVSDRNNTNSQLSANSTTELISESLFLDVNASRNQQIIDSDQPIGFNNIAVTTNVTDVMTYSISPYYQHRFGNSLEALVRYTNSNVDFRKDEVTDSEQNSISLTLNSPSNAIGFGWGLDYISQKSELETGTETEFMQGSITLGYRFTPRISLSATSGKEENTFSTNASQNIDDSYWNVDLNLQIGSRDTVLLGYGERYFGNTESFNWQHSGRRLNFSVDYTEEVSNFALSLLQSQQTADTASNQPLVNNAGSISSQSFVREVGTLNASYDFSKTSIRVLYSNDRRLTQNSSDYTRLQTVNAQFSLRSSSVLTYSLGTRWIKNYTSNTNAKTFNTFLDFSVERRLSPSMRAALTINHNLRHSTSATNDYEENIYSISLSKTFN